MRPEFFTGLGAALLVSVYDYWGYYNVCFFGGEVKDPGRTIPRAVLLSILFVAIIYIVMNISILGVIPWREFAGTANTPAQRYVISSFMERLYGPKAGGGRRRADHVDRVRVGFLAAARLLARALRRRARWQLLSHLR